MRLLGIDGTDLCGAAFVVGAERAIQGKHAHAEAERPWCSIGREAIDAMGAPREEPDLSRGREELFAWWMGEGDSRDWSWVLINM